VGLRAVDAASARRDPRDLQIALIAVAQRSSVIPKSVKRLSEKVTF